MQTQKKKKNIKKINKKKKKKKKIITKLPKNGNEIINIKSINK